MRRLLAKRSQKYTQVFKLCPLSSPIGQDFWNDKCDFHLTAVLKKCTMFDQPVSLYPHCVRLEDK